MKTKHINYFGMDYIHFLIILISSIIILPTIIQSVTSFDFILSGTVAGLIGGAFGSVYLRLYKNKKTSIKIFLTFGYILLFFLLFILTLVLTRFEGVKNPYISEPKTYFREIQVMDLPSTKNTYVNQKNDFKIDYPDNWEKIDLPTEKISVAFKSKTSLSEDFYPNFNIILTPIKNKFTTEDLLESNKKTMRKLSEQMGYSLVSSEVKKLLNGDAIETITHYIDKNELKIIQRQTRILYKDDLYTLTYTSSEKDFYKYLSVVDSSIQTLR